MCCAGAACPGFDQAVVKLCPGPARGRAHQQQYHQRSVPAVAVVFAVDTRLRRQGGHPCGLE
ncbi:MAG: hypothetical protein ACK559_03270, partial [bacterium]